MPPDDMAAVRRQAQRRQAANLAYGRRNTRRLGADNPERDLAMHILGCSGERVLSHMLDYPWDEDDFERPHHRGDVGPYDVRTTDRLRGGLLIRDDDLYDQRICFLVIAATPRFRVVGSIRYGEGKQDRWWRTKNMRCPAWIVPQHALTPFEPERWKGLDPAGPSPSPGAHLPSNVMPG